MNDAYHTIYTPFSHSDMLRYIALWPSSHFCRWVHIGCSLWSNPHYTPPHHSDSSALVRFKLPHCVCHRIISHMNIAIHRRFNAGMTEQFLQNLRLHTAPDSFCGYSVPSLRSCFPAKTRTMCPQSCPTEQECYHAYLQTELLPTSSVLLEA